MYLQAVLAGAAALSVLEVLLTNKIWPDLQFAGTTSRALGLYFILNIFIYTLYRILIFPNFVCLTRHFKYGPKTGNLLVGQGIRLRTHVPPGSLFREWIDDIPNDGVLRFRDLVGESALFLTSAATMREVLVDRSYDYIKQKFIAEVLRAFIGDGLVTAEGNMHKFQRKHLLPSFQVSVIRDLHSVFWNKACELSNTFRDFSQQSELEFNVWCTRVTLDIIGIGIGHDFNSLKNPEDKMVRMYQDILEVDIENAILFVLTLSLGASITSRIPIWKAPRKFIRISDEIHAFGADLARTRRAEMNDPKVPAEVKARRNDILSLLVKSNDFSDEELAHQILTFLAAGHETTSNTLSWAVFSIAQQPELMRDLRTEIRANLPSPDKVGSETITASMLDDMPLLNAVCNETTRLYPLVPITSREAIKETEIDGRKVAKGTVVYISPWAVNRSTRAWGEDAEKFRPQRWINADGKVNNTGGAASNYDLMTFLHGPRSCIGQGFAKAELRCLVAAIIGRYDVKITRDEKLYFPAGLITTKPAHGMWLKFDEVPGW